MASPSMLLQRLKNAHHTTRKKSSGEPLRVKRAEQFRGNYLSIVGARLPRPYQWEISLKSHNFVMHPYVRIALTDWRGSRTVKQLSNLLHTDTLTRQAITQYILRGGPHGL